jgi:hypothetical protein
MVDKQNVILENSMRESWIRERAPEYGVFSAVIRYFGEVRVRFVWPI